MSLSGVMINKIYFEIARISRNGLTMLVPCGAQGIRTIDLRKGMQISAVLGPLQKGFSALTISESLESVASRHDDQRVLLWNAVTGKQPPN